MPSISDDDDLFETSRSPLKDVSFNEASDSGSDFEPQPKKKKAPSPKKPAGGAKNTTAAKAPPKKKGENAASKKAPVKRKAAENDEENGDDPLHVFESIEHATQGGRKRLSVERIYQKKTQLEHILLRPDTYIGSTEFIDKQAMWVYDREKERIVFREVTFVPGLYKIFDEIVVNAADNKQRDKNMTTMKIKIDTDNNEISIWNNGKGIPVVQHEDEKVFVPELIFGTLLTSSNYDDSQRKVTGGRNGFGAKLCNIFSKKFTVETSCKEYKQSYKQTWTNNMDPDGKSKAVISDAKSEDFTKVTFKPDLKKFHMEKLDDDLVSLMSRRAFDVAGTTCGVKVFLNSTRVPVVGFKQYVEQYVKDKTDDNGEPLKVVYEQVSRRWEIAVTVSTGGFQQVSFVNSIATTKGGRHVDYVADMVTSKLIEHIKKKIGKAGVNIKPFQIKNHMWLFVNCLIENPTFDSQTKENMTLQAKSFGSKCELADKFVQQCLKCGIVESVMAWVRYKQQSQLDNKCSSRKTSKLKGVAKLEDANDAGTKNSSMCTLILTEGDSAKTLAVSGLGVVGRDRYGVFPLKGKMLNVRDAAHKQILENHEINQMIKIIGLQYKKKYDSDEDFKTLRYGKVMIMADQDQDGSHIKGLFVNFIHHNWPSLLRRNFVDEFITPIVKATKGQQEIPFFSLPEYQEWKAETDNWHTYRIKYYKGLGTSTAKEAKEYFSDMARHRIKFRYRGDDDDSAIELAFSKKKVEERKGWLTNWMRERKERREAGLGEEYLYERDTKAVTFQDFVNKELVLFSNMDNERSIPSLVDGLKPGQRKVLFTCIKRNDKREVKVAQLAGSVGEQSAYHHGEASLMSTIVNLAHNFVGSNNINLLLPIGQFGTRLQGGKDSASPRYIFTMMSPVTRTLFHPDDDAVLHYLSEDNQRIEPDWYMPIIPTVLVNGAEGIGTGWSTKVPNFNPREIAENLRRLMRDEPALPMKPWYKGFNGSIERLDSTRFISSGEISLLDDSTIEISELPIQLWTQKYKEDVLEPMLGGEKQQPFINDFKEYHTDTTVKFVVKMEPNKLDGAEREGLHKVFKLQKPINTSSMVLFDAEGCLRRFEAVEEIMENFFSVRRRKYIERKNYLEGMLQAQALRLSNQARFILEKIDGKIVLENKKKKIIVEALIARNYDPDPVRRWKEEQRKKQEETEEDAAPMTEEEEGGEDEDTAPTVDPTVAKLADFDYLVTMQLIKLSEEEKDKLLKDRDTKKHELSVLEGKTWSDLWTEDLDAFLAALDKQEEKERQDELDSAKQAGGKKKAKGAATANKAPAKRKAVAELAEVRPSPMGRRVEPKIDPSLKARMEKADEAKQKKGVRKNGAAKKADLVEEDDVNLSLSERLKKNDPSKSEAIRRLSGQQQKATITRFLTTDAGKDGARSAKNEKEAGKKVPAKKAKKTNWESDSDDEEDVKPKRAKKTIGDSDDDVVKESRKLKRAAEKPKKTKKTDWESDSEDEEDFKPKRAKKIITLSVGDSDDDDDVKEPKRAKSPLSASSGSEEDEQPKTAKPKSKKVPPPQPKTAKSNSWSGSDVDEVPSTPPKRDRPTRGTKKPVKYTIEDDEESGSEQSGGGDDSEFNGGAVEPADDDSYVSL